jgi:hypothetical protein
VASAPEMGRWLGCNTRSPRAFKSQEVVSLERFDVSLGGFEAWSAGSWKSSGDPACLVIASEVVDRGWFHANRSVNQRKVFVQRQKSYLLTSAVVHNPHPFLPLWLLEEL